MRTTTREKGQTVTRTLVARDHDGEAACFPFVAQAAMVHRHRAGRTPETVALLTSRPSTELARAQWLTANTLHWGIETGLHARLDASRHDDRLRLRRPRRSGSMPCSTAGPTASSCTGAASNPRHATSPPPIYLQHGGKS